MVRSMALVCVLFEISEVCDIAEPQQPTELEAEGKLLLGDL